MAYWTVLYWNVFVEFFPSDVCDGVGKTLETPFSAATTKRNISNKHIS